MSLTIAGTTDQLEEGTSYLHLAAELWALVEPRRGAAIRAWLRDEWAAHEQDPDLEVYDVGSLRRLLGLLDGLGDALAAELTDPSWRVDADTATRLRADHELLVDSWIEPAGPVHTLENRISEVHQLEAFVRRAIAMNRSIEVG